MTRILCAVLLAASTSASAAPASLPSFENAALQLHATVRALRAASVKAANTDLGARLDSLAWDLQSSQQDVSRMRNDLRFLMTRVNTPQPGRPDPNLRWDLQRFTQDLDSMARDAQWRLDDVRALSSQIAQKDPNLVAPAQRLVNAANWLKSETGWLVFDGRFAVNDLTRAGFAFESMDLQRNSDALDRAAQDLQGEGRRLLAKVQ